MLVQLQRASLERLRIEVFLEQGTLSDEALSHYSAMTKAIMAVTGSAWRE